MSTTYIARFADQMLDALMPELPAIMLTGPRGCGKTTTAVRRAASTLRLDRPEQAEAFRTAPDAILAAQKEPVLIDEWQNVPESLGAVKRSVDSGVGGGRFLITGSVRSRLSDQGWPATGRVVPVTMYGLAQAEIEQAPDGSSTLMRLFSEAEPSPGALTGAPQLTDYLDMAVRGGFPDAIGFGDLARAAWYEGYVEQLVHHDVSELDIVRDPTAMANLVRAVAFNTAGVPSIASLSEAAQINGRTTQSYLDLLTALRIMDRLPAWGINRFNRMVKSPKYYLTDTGMAVYLAGDNRTGLLTSGTRLGRIIDTFVMAQIRPLLTVHSPRINAFHLRDANGRHEVDLVLETASGKIVGIEIKSAATVNAKDARHLAWLRDELGDTFVRGIVLHTGNMAFPLGHKLWAMPIAALWRSL
ncbi:MAG: DUF4143 domain-containing protein [Propionibacteriaceae bacterium]|jgi:predicted AAA+ superfamily ATPase|nr:DUF4143 domain-containing protein [Propionibacteriaceae bacterium]